MSGIWRALLTVLLLALSGCSNAPDEPPKLRLAASVYVGWMPWMLAAEDGTLKSEGAQRGLDIRLTRDSYVATIEAYLAGHVDAVVMTNIDALAFLPGSGIPSDVILIGSYSNGNDAIVVRDPALASLKGQKLALVEGSVSHYLLDRYLEQQQLPASAVGVVNVSDADIARVYVESAEQLAGAVTWKPIVSDLVERAGGHVLVDSSATPREIADMLVVRRDVLNDHPGFAKALLATWFKVTARLRGPERAPTLAALAKLSATSAVDYESQLKTTVLIDQPAAAITELTAKSLAPTMQRVEAFVLRHELLKNPPPTPWSAQSSNNATLNFNPLPLAR
jgi:NitT/TauT family transport system substrate-binding protein